MAQNGGDVVARLYSVLKKDKQMKQITLENLFATKNNNYYGN